MTFLKSLKKRNKFEFNEYFKWRNCNVNYLLWHYKKYDYNIIIIYFKIKLNQNLFV